MWVRATSPPWLTISGPAVSRAVVPRTPSCCCCRKPIGKGQTSRRIRRLVQKPPARFRSRRRNGPVAARSRPLRIALVLTFSMRRRCATARPAGIVGTRFYPQCHWITTRLSNCPSTAEASRPGHYPARPPARVSRYRFASPPHIGRMLFRVAAFCFRRTGRLRQVRPLARALTDAPIVLAGDFNTWFGTKDAAYPGTRAALRRSLDDRSSADIFHAAVGSRLRVSAGRLDGNIPTSGPPLRFGSLSRDCRDLDELDPAVADTLRDPRLTCRRRAARDAAGRGATPPGSAR